MPRLYSPQLCDQVVAAIDSGMSVAEVAETFQIARRTIYYYLQRSRLNHGTAATISNRGPRSKLDDYRIAILRALRANPDLTIKELCELLKLPVSPSALSRWLQRWSLSTNTLPSQDMP